ncbi:hypothetical protein CAOG_07960 [Capsaspora owczarzaki ATCC 30864]|uniref:RRM domain-containing protein n=1 Tax=Capsaspora owczarzaki (strain ATCC 30864) TaxID=595528 RepID=A0A0D2USC9_CAPO3|nr:hypothetical protein CAOG_07960 [Capsaspora owczarzaki ATCC 30864]KJE97881.1 hypothetical protein CAOG_007960 [Capsaspora owczarzaki ATCC 30864]|eukprot:XP_004343048.1 hypothetical protein CAOG_07960 [Capsaspora owczarzaki ATCC 30864]
MASVLLRSLTSAIARPAAVATAVRSVAAVQPIRMASSVRVQWLNATDMDAHTRSAVKCCSDLLASNDIVVQDIRVPEKEVGEARQSVAKGYAFFRLNNADDVRRASRAFETAPPIFLPEGLQLIMVPSRDTETDPTLFVSFGASPDAVANVQKIFGNFFGAFGTIMNIEVQQNKYGAPTGFGFVNFTEDEAAEKAATELRGTASPLNTPFFRVTNVPYLTEEQRKEATAERFAQRVAARNERRAYNRDGERPADGERRPYNGERRQYNGERRPYNGERRQYNGERRPFQRRDRGEQQQQPQEQN